MPEEYYLVGKGGDRLPTFHRKENENKKNEEESVLQSSFSSIEFTLSAEHLTASGSFTVRCSSLMEAQFLPQGAAEGLLAG